MGIMNSRIWVGRSGCRGASRIGPGRRHIPSRENAMTDAAFYRLTELDRTTWPEIRDQILRFEHDTAASEPRSYPGYPLWPLDRVRARLWPNLDGVLRGRRSLRRLGTQLPTRKTLSRLLTLAHGVHDSHGRGPTP